MAARKPTNVLRPTALAFPIWAASGIVAGLLLFDMPFGFVALLGAMSLGGIMLRNSVVLLETIDLYKQLRMLDGSDIQSLA